MRFDSVGQAGSRSKGHLWIKHQHKKVKLPIPEYSSTISLLFLASGCSWLGRVLQITIDFTITVPSASRHRRLEWIWCGSSGRSSLNRDLDTFASWWLGGHCRPSDLPSLPPDSPLDDAADSNRLTSRLVHGEIYVGLMGRLARLHQPLQAQVLVERSWWWRRHVHDLPSSSVRWVPVGASTLRLLILGPSEDFEKVRCSLFTHVSPTSMPLRQPLCSHLLHLWKVGKINDISIYIIYT